ncbi:MAG TPA: nuclear transport factor 2 family protein [Candidatus Limnocylindria bacterium]|nr:nuclear transport factor 2 family protein [Candidatus Limnocylindria bacterium]
MKIVPEPKLREEDAASLVQRQLDAYNAHDVDAIMGTYAENAQQFEYPSKLLASGAAEIRERFRARFQEPNLQATLLQRMVMDQVVIDLETVTRTFPEGAGTIELIAIYEVHQGRIAKASFIFGPKKSTSGTAFVHK